MNEHQESALDNAEDTADLPSKGERIQALNDIDHDIAKVLQLAGQAIQILGKVPGDDNDQQRLSTEERKRKYSNTVADYCSVLSRVDVNLRRQIMALEEAGIIPAGPARDGPGASDVRTTQDKTGKDTGALGSLDVGWLNSRTDKVGKEMEAELWTQARELLEELRHEQGGNSGDTEMKD